MTTPAENLRSRFHPAWHSRSDLAGLPRMFEDALTFIEAPKTMKEKIERPRTLNGRGVSEALRAELARNVVPELRRSRRTIAERKEALNEERKVLGAPVIHYSDVSSTLLRQEARTYLRGLDIAQRMRLLLENPDEIIVTAALEGPAALSGLTDDARRDVHRAYVERRHANEIKALDEREEALDVVGAAVEIAILEVRSNVGLGPNEFDHWFETAGTPRTAQAA